MRMPLALCAVFALSAAPAAAPASAPIQTSAAFLVIGPFVKITPRGGFMIRVKKGNEAGLRFAGHKVVLPIAKSTFVVDDVNGDGQQDAQDFVRGDRVKVVKRQLPPTTSPSGPDPQKLGPARIQMLAGPTSP
jgi:hypothetical protein